MLANSVSPAARRESALARGSGRKPQTRRRQLSCKVDDLLITSGSLKASISSTRWSSSAATRG